MNLCGWIFHRVLGWRSAVDVPRPGKCVLCIAPHTSNWDFIIAMLYEKSSGGHAHFLMKKEWFFWPLGGMFRALGGIPVARAKDKDGKPSNDSTTTTATPQQSLTARLASKMKEARAFQLAITPEGTRAPNKAWHTGFYHIAREANVPILLYIINYKDKCVSCQKQLMPTADKAATIALVKDYYSHYANAAKYPEKFSV